MIPPPLDPFLGRSVRMSHGRQLSAPLPFSNESSQLSSEVHRQSIVGKFPRCIAKRPLLEDDVHSDSAPLCFGLVGVFLRIYGPRLQIWDLPTRRRRGRFQFYPISGQMVRHREIPDGQQLHAVRLCDERRRLRGSPRTLSPVRVQDLRLERSEPGGPVDRAEGRLAGQNDGPLPVQSESFRRHFLLGDVHRLRAVRGRLVLQSAALRQPAVGHDPVSESHPGRGPRPPAQKSLGLLRRGRRRLHADRSGGLRRRRRPIVDSRSRTGE